MSTTFDNVASHDKPNKRREESWDEKKSKIKTEKTKKNIFHDDYRFANPEIKKHLHVPQEIWRIK